MYYWNIFLHIGIRCMVNVGKYVTHLDPMGHCRSLLSNPIVVDANPRLPPRCSAQAVDAQVFAETPSAGEVC